MVLICIYNQSFIQPTNTLEINQTFTIVVFFSCGEFMVTQYYCRTQTHIKPLYLGHHTENLG